MHTLLPPLTSKLVGVGVLSNKLPCCCSSHIPSEVWVWPRWNSFLRSNKTGTTGETSLYFPKWEFVFTYCFFWTGQTNLCRSLCSTGRWRCWAQREPTPQAQRRTDTPILTSLHRTWTERLKMSGLPQTNHHMSIIRLTFNTLNAVTTDSI